MNTYATSPVTARRPFGRFAARIETWQLFTGLVGIMLALAWFNDSYVLTRDVYHALLSDRMDVGRIDEQIAFMQRSARWAYLALPLGLWARLALVALLLQTVSLLTNHEVPFRALFRAVCWGFIPLAYGAAIRMLWLMRQDPRAVDERVLNFAPGSIAATFLTRTDANALTYDLLSLVSVWEAAWIVVVSLSLRATRLASTRASFAIVVGVWSLLTVVQWALTAYLSKIG